MIALSDLNACSVIQYAVEYLKVKHIIVCGHYGCGGVKASLSNASFGLLVEWISHIKINTGEILKSDSSFNEKFKMAVELNVLASVRNLSCMPLIQQVWNNSQRLDIHGWVYDIKDGKLTDLGFDVGSIMDLDGLGADRKY